MLQQYFFFLPVAWTARGKEKSMSLLSKLKLVFQVLKYRLPIFKDAEIIIYFCKLMRADGFLILIRAFI